jgi:hypothetical protein
MPTNRARVRRIRQLEITEGTWWWLEHGRPLGIAQAEAMGCFEEPTRAAPSPPSAPPRRLCTSCAA